MATPLTVETLQNLEPLKPFRVGDWLVDAELDEITRGDEIQKLEPRMVRLLVHLAQRPGQVVSTKHLLDSVWSDVVVGPASVYQAVSQLRKLLGDTGTTPAYIATVPRKGYRLIAPSPRPGAPDGETPPATAGRRRFSWWLALGTAAVVAFTALAIRGPGQPPEAPAGTDKALATTSPSTTVYTAFGEGAEGIRLAEQALRLQPDSPAGAALINWYLDLDLPDAAADVSAGLMRVNPRLSPTFDMAKISLRRGDLAKAASFARLETGHWQFWGQPVPSLAHAVRDDAIARGNFEEAVPLIGAEYDSAESAQGWQRADLAIVYAHTLILAGRKQEGEALVRQLVSEIGSGYGAVQRASLLALLGKDDAALTELELSASGSHPWGWWYVIERDPLFERLRSNARFKAVAEQSRRYYANQRVLLGRMIAEGSVPKRGGP